MGVVASRYNIQTGERTLTDFLAVVKDKGTTTIFGEEKDSNGRVYFREVIDKNSGRNISKDKFGVWDPTEWVYAGLSLGTYFLFPSTWKRFSESREFEKFLAQAYEQGGRQGLAEFFSFD